VIGSAVRRWAPVLLCVAAFVASLLSQHLIFPALSWNRDEVVYLWQTDLLRAGQLAVGDGGFPNLFQPWLSAAEGGELYPQYTLGWPLVLLVGRFVGSTDFAVAGGAAMVVGASWLFVREVIGDRRVATLAATFLLLSPILVLQGGLHLNYLFSLGLGLLFLTATFAGARTGRSGLLVAGGLALGWVVMTRPFDAVVWAALGGAYVLLRHGAPWRTQARRAVLLGLGAAGPVAVVLLVNNRLTGSPFEFPITVADPLDKFGFGDRRLMPGFDLVPYGKRTAIESTARNAFWLPLFLVGAHLGALIALVEAWRRRRERAVWLLLALGLAFPIFYFPFFGTQISSVAVRLTGPIYYIPAFVPLCTLLAMAVVDLYRRRAAVAIGLGIGLVLVSVPILLDRADVNHELSLANEPWDDSLDAIDGAALVVVSPQPYVMYSNPFGDNGADDDGRILFASDTGPELVDLIAEHADRAPYLQRPSLTADELLPSEHPNIPEVFLTPIETLEGPRATFATTLGSVPASWLEIDEEVVTDPARGETTWVLAPLAGSRAPAGVTAISAGLHTVDVVAGTGPDQPTARRRFYVRAGADGITVLAPGTGAIFRPADVPDGIDRWIDTFDVTTTIDVSVAVG
jgi:hypothetical protein